MTTSLALRIACIAVVLATRALAADPTLPATCPAATPPPLLLPHVRQNLARNHQIVIVAFGSSSTAGWRASDVAHSYPAVLQQLLGVLLPTANVTVVNRGIGGQDITAERARIDTDVVAIRPQLVIWQTGTNDALRNVDPNVFATTLRDGVSALQHAGADVVLMDNQRAARVDRAPDTPRIEAAIARVADQTGAELFSRRALMDRWQQEGAPPAAFTASDGLHHNDRGYACLATALADAIARGAARPPQAEALAQRLLRGG